MTIRADPAEDHALAHLERQGLILVARNYACRGGEIDLIMRDGATLVFVEVRHRTRSEFGTPEETVGANKQHRLVLAARHYLARNPAFARSPMRFDVVALSGPLIGAEFRWIRNAIIGDG
ncbi:MAG TPA: YraN family protein [Candidatus Acidoferrales bacterium]|nr:YraN family protein [Candidatus Acidoferrales bacterium]